MLVDGENSVNRAEATVLWDRGSSPEVVGEERQVNEPNEIFNTRKSQEAARFVAPEIHRFEIKPSSQVPFGLLSEARTDRTLTLWSTPFSNYPRSASETRYAFAPTDCDAYLQS